MEDCMKYWVELNDLMVDLHEAIKDGDVVAIKDIIATCEYTLHDIIENLPVEDDYFDEE